MKYDQADVDELNRLIKLCLSIPDIKNERHLKKLLDELQSKVNSNKRFKNSLNLRKEAAIYSRNHGFRIPRPLNELLIKINDVYMGKNKKHNWFGFIHNLD